MKKKMVWKSNSKELQLEKINQWMNKAKREKDPFNRYISEFIAFNIFYNLYAKTRDPEIDLQIGDKKRAISCLDIISIGTILGNDSYSNLVHQLEKEGLGSYIGQIPLFREEYWCQGSDKTAISQKLKEEYESRDYQGVIEYLTKWLYKIRCNIFHGEKEYVMEEQKELVRMSYNLLHVILKNLVKKYKIRFSPSNTSINNNGFQNPK